MKPQATRIGNQKKALNNRLTYLVRLTKLAQSKLNALRFHPKHAKWSAAILAVVAFTTVCLQAITTPLIESQAANQWHPVSIPAVAAPTVMPEAFVTESQPVADAIPELTESIFRIRNGDSLSLIFARAGYG